MKKIIYYILSLFIIVIITQTSFAQIAVGEWKNHLPLNKGKKIVLTEDDVYMLSEDGLIKYSKKSGEVDILSTINGLNDVNPSEIAYNESHKYLIIGYVNGNIDLIKDNKITNISDIKQKSINGDKKIYSIHSKDELIYIGCGFGVVVLNPSQKEIKETWYIGKNGTNVKINSIDSHENTIFLATDSGIYKGDLTKHLPDFSNWEIITKENLPPDFLWLENGNFNFIKYFNGKIIANSYVNNGGENDNIVVYNNGSWSFLDKEKTNINAICGNDDLLLICTRYGVTCYDKDLQEYNRIGLYATESKNIHPSPKWAENDKNNKIWIADSEVGLIECNDFWHSINIKINGPLNKFCFDMSSDRKSVFIAPGGYSRTTENSWNSFQFYKYKDGEWANFSKKDFPKLDDFRDVVRVIADPQDETRYICATWNFGIVEFRNNDLYKIYDKSNSTLETVNGNTTYIRISDLCFDKKGNLWATNVFASPALHVLTRSNKWVSFNLSSYFNQSTTILNKIITTKDNVKWISLARSEKILVLDDNGTPEDKSDDKIRILRLINEKGETISSNIYSIKEDLKGNIWIGCDKGVAVFYNAKDVFRKENFFAKQVVIPRKDGTNSADLLLSAETVTSIAVDGGNKKWFGTENGGAYYTSEDGLEEIHHFTTDNSPILSNNILSITIVPESGEVFFGTSSGVISYGGTATQGKEEYDNVYAYPNPVKPDFYGPITITGLIPNSIVKITDISGNLVYETTSDGGNATWDGKNINGEKVKTGVYLVMASDEKGQKKVATKILFINSKE